MPIKYAENVNPNNEVKNHERKNYTGASNGSYGPNSVGRPLSPRESLRQAGQTKGKRNPLLGACQSRKTKVAMMQRPASTRSSNPDIRAYMKWYARKMEEQ